MLKIRNLRNKNKNKTVANQFIVTDGENGLVYFQSYDRVIVQLDCRRKTCMLSPKFVKSIRRSKNSLKKGNEKYKKVLAI